MTLPISLQLVSQEDSNMVQKQQLFQEDFVKMSWNYDQTTKKQTLECFSWHPICRTIKELLSNRRIPLSSYFALPISLAWVAKSYGSKL